MLIIIKFLTSYKATALKFSSIFRVVAVKVFILQ